MESDGVACNYQHIPANQPLMDHRQPSPQQVTQYSALALAMPANELRNIQLNYEINRPVELQLVYVAIPYEPYINPRNVPFQNHEVTFRSSNGHAMSLKDALMENYADVVNGEVPALPEDVGIKLSLRLHFQGCRPYTRQIRARHSTANSDTITVKTLAIKIAEEVDKYMVMTRNADAPLRYGNAEIELEYLYLDRLYRVSHGSWEADIRALLWV